MRRKAKVQEKLEKLSVSDGLRAVKFAEVVVVLLDADIPFEQQDLRIADLAEREGRAVVVAVNKWDLETDKQGKLKDLRESFERLLPQLKGAPLVTVSAKTGRGMDRLHNAIMRAYEVWNRRVTTAQLNRWLSGMMEAHPPPAPQGKRIKLRYILSTGYGWTLTCRARRSACGCAASRTPTPIRGAKKRNRRSCANIPTGTARTARDCRNRDRSFQNSGSLRLTAPP